MARNTNASPADEILNQIADTADPALPDFGGTPGQQVDEEFEFDFADMGDIDDGLYPGRCSDVVLTKAKNGKPMYQWEISLLDQGRALPYYTSLSPAARWKVGETLIVFGVAPSPDQSVAKFKRSDVIGKPCLVQIVNQPTQADPNRKRPSIQNLLAPDEKTRALNDLP